MPFIFYIDDQRVDQPMNDLELTTKIKRDDDIGGIVITQDATLEWFKENVPADGEISGYDYLKGLFDDGICNEATIVIYNQVSDTETYMTHTGIIKLPQLEFDEKEISLSTKIQDNSFYSYIYNNRELQVNLQAVQTKNKLNIDELVWYSVDLFNGCDGAFGAGAGALFKGYLITDVFEFIIAVITDNKVSFQSDYLSGLDYPLMLFKGESILNAYTVYPGSNPVFDISLQTLITEIDRLKNIYFYVDQSDPDVPVFRVEAMEETFSQQTNVTLSEPLNLKTTVDTRTLYGKVSAGSQITVDGSNTTGCIYTMNEAISYYGFKDEQFFPLGQCNTSTELNLVNEWIISNNVIQDILIGQSTNYMDNYVLIECDAVDPLLLTANAFPWSFYGQVTPPFLYNVGLNNYNKLQRHSSKFETAFGNFLGIGSLGFKALLGDDPIQDITYVTGPLTHPNFIPPGGQNFAAEFVNETTNGGYDGSGSYNNLTFEYTVPQDGDYSFTQQIHYEVTGLSGPSYFDLGIQIILYDSAMTIKSSGGSTNLAFNNGFFVSNGTLVANCVAGDIVRANYGITYNPNGVGPIPQVQTLTVIWDSFFECNGTPEGGVTITAGNDNIRKLLHEFQHHINDTDWRQILANPTGVLPFVKDDVTRYGWIKEMTRNDQTGLTSIKLLSSNATA